MHKETFDSIKNILYLDYGVKTSHNYQNLKMDLIVSKLCTN